MNVAWIPRRIPRNLVNRSFPMMWKFRENDKTSPNISLRRLRLTLHVLQHRFRARPHVELPVDIAQVEADGFHPHSQLVGDLLVEVTLGQEIERFLLPL